MKKRILSMALCLCMVLTLLPVAALAEELPTDEPTAVEPTVETPAADEALAAVQAQIDALPTAEEIAAMDEDGKQAVSDALDAIDIAADALTGEQLTELNMAKYEAVYLALVADTEQPALYDITVGTQPTGDGTSESPYQIESAENLLWFANCVNGTNGVTQNKGAWATLAANIDLSTVCSASLDSWTPIGATVSYGYEGTFDGANFTISGLYINTGAAGYQGLFSINSGTIKNLTVAGSVTGNASSGKLAGLCAWNMGTISGCTNAVDVALKSNGEYVGGICGTNGGTLESCHNTGTVSYTNSNPSAYMGGICGQNIDTIKNCINTKRLTGYNNATLTGDRVGSICGQNNYSTIQNCYYLTGTSANGVGKIGGGTNETTVKTAEEFKTGAVAYLLNNTKADGTQAWYQTLGEGGDAYPVLIKTENNTVYQTAENSYSNEMPEVIITSQPADATLAPGGSAALTVAVQKKLDSSTVTYQWYKDGTEEENKIPNAIEATYSATEAGDYLCAVTCGSFTVVSRAATVSNAVASVTAAGVGSTPVYYAVFNDALNAAKGSEGSTLALLGDINVDSSLTINEGKFTLDLGAHTLTVTNLYLERGINLTITATTGGITGAVNAGYNKYLYGSLTITGGTFTSLQCMMDSWQSTVPVSLQGGTFTNGVSIRKIIMPGETSSAPAVSEMLAEGYGYQQNGAWVTDAETLAGSSLTGPVTVNAIVASIKDANGTHIGNYDTLAKAVTAAQESDGCTVKLLQNVTTSAKITVTGGKFSIDLNGKTWRRTGLGIALQIATGDITLMDSATGGKIIANDSLDYQSSSCISLEGTNGTIPKLTITGGTYQSNEFCMDCSHSNTTITGGSFEGTVGGSGITLNIENGNFQSIATDVSSTVNITNGTFSDVVSITGSNVSISGGTFNNTVVFMPATDSTLSLTGGSYAELLIYCDDGDNRTLADALAAGYAYRSTQEGKAWVANPAVAELTNVTVEKIPVKITAQPQDAEIVPPATGVKLSITAAAVNGTDALTYQWYKGSVADANKVGTNSNTYTATEAGNYLCTVTCDGCTVTSNAAAVTMIPAVASVTLGNKTTKYADLAKAIAAAQESDGCTVKLLQDVTTSTQITVKGGKFTIDLNGKTWCRTGLGIALQIATGDITLMDSATGGKIIAKDYTNLDSSHCVRVEGTKGATPKLTVTGGTYEARVFSIIGSGSNITITGGNFAGTVGGASITLNVENGNFQNLIAENSSTVNITNGTFSNAVIIDQSNATMTGGDFNITSFQPAENSLLSLTGGSYAKLTVEGENKTLADVLAAGYAYRSTQEGKAWVANPAVAELTNVTVERVPSASSGGGTTTTTTTTKNEDGSITTTTTNTATGTVTETTKQPDGSTIVVETKKDGTAITTDKASNGVTTVTKTDKNGKPTSATVTVPSTVKDPVKVDVPTNLGKADGEVSAVVTYPNGKKETVTGKYENGKVSLTVSGSATIEILDDFVPLASALPFTDVPADAWYYDELLYVYQNGLFAGTSATTFNPKANMTREQMWMVLARMAGEKPADMDAARAWAMAKNISDGSNPKNPVTREQFVTLLWRFAGSPESDGAMGLAGYDDATAIADYAHEAMLWAVKNQIVSGTSTTTLSPKGNASRAQIAVILARYKQK